jgi:hypothetical protein
LLPPVELTRLLVVLLSLLSLLLLQAAVLAAAVLSRLALSGICEPKAFMWCQRRCAAEIFRACGAPRRSSRAEPRHAA